MGLVFVLQLFSIKTRVRDKLEFDLMTAFNEATGTLWLRYFSLAKRTTLELRN